MEAVQVVGGSPQIKAPGGSTPSACVWVDDDKGWPPGAGFCGLNSNQVNLQGGVDSAQACVV